jgi:hypothetical protein
MESAIGLSMIPLIATQVVGLLGSSGNNVFTGMHQTSSELIAPLRPFYDLVFAVFLG